MNEPHTLEEQNGGVMRGWISALFPFITVLVLGGIAWGTFSARLETFDARFRQIERQLEIVNDIPVQLARLQAIIASASGEAIQEARVLRIERQQALEAVNGRLLALEARVGLRERDYDTVWPRLRSLGENLQLLRNALLREHPDAQINLSTPEKF